MGWKRVLQAIALLVIVAASPSWPPSAAQGEVFNLNLAITREAVTISGPYYRAEINLTMGGRVTDWWVRLANGTMVDLVGSDTYLPSLALYAYLEAPPETLYNVSYGGGNYVVSYPGSLSFEPWSIEVEVNTSDVVVLRLIPGREALRDVAPVFVDVTLTMRSWTPVLEYRARFFNPTNETVLLRGSILGPEILLSVDDGTPEAWLMTLADLSSAGLLGAPFNESGTVVDVSRLESASLVRLSDLSDPSSVLFMAGVKPLEGEPVLVTFNRGYATLNGTIEAPAFMRIVYGVMELGPGEEESIGLAVSYIEASPLLVSLSGLEASYLALGPPLAEELNNATLLEDLVEDLEARVSRLEEENRNLSERVGELEGLVDYYKLERGVILERQLDRLRSDLSRAQLLAVAGFLGGVALGLIGGMFVVRREIWIIRREAVRRPARPARRR